MARFSPRQGTFAYFDDQDGLTALRSVEIWGTRRFRDGECALFGMKGFVLFHPQRLALNRRPPRLAATACEIGSLRRELRNGASTIRARLGALDILTVEFAALDFLRPEKNQYAWRFERKETAWRYQGTDRMVKLAKLKPGLHRLQVKAANNDGFWNETGIRLSVRILPPLWLSWPAFLLYGLLLAALVAYTVWMQARYRRAKQGSIPENLEPLQQKFSISKRELEVLRLVLYGKSNKQIEDELYISLPTVKIHIHNIFKKMKVGSRLQLLLRVQEEAKKFPAPAQES